MKEQQQQYVLTAVIAVAVGAGAFFGGMQYQKSQTPTGRQFAGANGQMGNRQGITGANGQARTGGNFGGRGGGVTGEVLNQDDTSITVKAQDGSSKIVLLSDKTTYNTASSAAKTDLKVGSTVSAFGTPNSDGSITATMVQLNPILTARPSTSPVVAPITPGK